MRALIALAVTGCMQAAAPTRTAPDEPRVTHVVQGMTVAEVRALLGPETGSRVSPDTRYELELGYRMPIRGTVTHVDGGGPRTETVETGAQLCIVFVIADRVANVKCTVEHYARPHRVPM